MKPIKFKESNKDFLKPDSMTEEECGSLPVFQDDKQIISCWKMGWKEVLTFLFTGKIWFRNLGKTQVPIYLGCKNPFK